MDFSAIGKPELINYLIQAERQRDEALAELIWGRPPAVGDRLEIDGTPVILLAFTAHPTDDGLRFTITTRPVTEAD